MQDYQLTYGHDSNGTPGRVTLQANSAREAIEQTRKFVADGFRNETWATVDLGDEGAYTARNVHGRAVGQVL